MGLFFCCFGSVLGLFVGKISVRLGSVCLDFGSVKTIGGTAIVVWLPYNPFVILQVLLIYCSDSHSRIYCIIQYLRLCEYSIIQQRLVLAIVGQTGNFGPYVRCILVLILIFILIPHTYFAYTYPCKNIPKQSKKNCFKLF